LAENAALAAAITTITATHTRIIHAEPRCGAACGMLFDSPIAISVDAGRSPTPRCCEVPVKPAWLGRKDV
jgi:hypothetical protein